MASGSDLNNSVMRTVSFVDRVEIQHPGNIISQTMVLGDVDNDMTNELVVGNIDGQIGIFKRKSPTAWKKTVVSGMLTCLAVGEIHTPKKNSLVCLTAEGWCHVYDVGSQSSAQNVTSTEEDSDSKHFQPTYTQEMPANSRVLCLADIDSDGHIEMVIGYSDRVVRAFRWFEPMDGEQGHFVLLQKWQLAGQIGSISINYTPDQLPELLVSQPGSAYVSLLLKPSHVRHNRSESHLDKMVGSSYSSRHDRPHRPLERSGSFAAPSSTTTVLTKTLNDPSEQLHKSEDSSIAHDISLDNLSESTSVHSLDIGLQKEDSKNKSYSRTKPEKISQSKVEEMGMSLSSLKLSFDRHDNHLAKFGERFLDTDSSCDRPLGRLLDASPEDSSIVYHPLFHHSQTRNSDTSTIILGGINRGRPSQSSTDQHHQSTYHALATLDGSLILAENDSIIWSLQVDHYLFALSKLDVTGNGKEEVVCCSWSGQTYIVNHSKEIVRYQFPDSVAAFCAGYFSVSDGVNVPCFVYATFNNRLYIYHNISLPRVESTNLLKVMGRMDEAQDLLRKLNVDGEDTESIRKLYHWCLYGYPQK